MQNVMPTRAAHFFLTKTALCNVYCISDVSNVICTCTELCILQGILQYVNKQLHLAQNRQRLLEHQSKLDTSALERTSHPIAQQFKVTYTVYVHIHI